MTLWLCCLPACLELIRIDLLSEEGKRGWRERERDMDRINVKIRTKKITLATWGPCWANLSRQTRAAAQAIWQNKNQCSPLQPASQGHHAEKWRKSTESFSEFTISAKNLTTRASDLKRQSPAAHLFVKVRSRRETLRWGAPGWDTPIPLAAQICPSAACLANLKKEKKLPQSTQKPRLVSHTLAAKSPQGRGGDEAECLLVAVKS